LFGFSGGSPGRRGRFRFPSDRARASSDLKRPRLLSGFPVGDSSVPPISRAPHSHNAREASKKQMSSLNRWARATGPCAVATDVKESMKVSTQRSRVRAASPKFILPLLGRCVSLGTGCVLCSWAEARRHKPWCYIQSQERFAVHDKHPLSLRVSSSSSRLKGL